MFLSPARFRSATEGRETSGPGQEERPKWYLQAKHKNNHRAKNNFLTNGELHSGQSLALAWIPCELANASGSTSPRVLREDHYPVG
jgi:hypothetical protein